ncbi:hypothetical protein IQ235_09630 [Oscillatoriales cyanobacterium LEGE 11467]|uniref:Uncharacterized protein n=1 Tax=Zarconia navalis LEGE 11467 TaxID=1828826 RepID=A0A928VWV8_9CYAN|nr:hypothetical protein [Zarconia navalis]MBE9041039.1 hypothetical protein [Zarconia navalis LEGE 11467]
MAQPDRNSNPDSDRPSQSIEQNIHLDRNEGRLNASSSGDRSNVIQGDGSQINHIGQQTIHYVMHPPVAEKRERLPRFWSDRRFVLFFWGCAIVGMLGTVETVFQPFKSYQQRMAFQNCAKVAREENKSLIIIADFAEDARNKNINRDFWLEKKLKDDPGGLKNIYDTEICHFKEVSKPISSEDDAKKIGKKLEVDVVIWGRISASSIEIRITSINASVAYLTKLEIEENILTENNREIFQLITVMTAYSLSENKKHQNQINDAIYLLDNTLKNTQSLIYNLKSEEYRKKLSEVYFYFSLLLELEIYNVFKVKVLNCLMHELECRNIIKALKISIKLNDMFYIAWIKKGYIHEQLNELQEARQCYEFIINAAPNHKVGAACMAKKRIEGSFNNSLHKESADFDVQCDYSM